MASFRELGKKADIPKPKTKKKKEFVLDVFLKATLRGAFKKTPMFQEAKRRAKVEVFEKSKHGKDLRRVKYRCAHCQQLFSDKIGQRDIAVDHIEPVIPVDHELKHSLDWIFRLFCSTTNLQVLCNYKGERDGTPSCHAIKTKKERAALAEFNRSKLAQHEDFTNE